MLNRRVTFVAALSCLAVTAALADPPGHEGHGGEAPHGPAMHGGPPSAPEPHAGPKGYQRVTEPHGWNERPKQVDRNTYQHNFQAARAYKIGPYHRPAGWSAHHWGFGQVLPRAYWAAQYLISDYWLFALEVPPAGFEWVRDDGDALLVNVQTGEILQVEYGAFS